VARKPDPEHEPEKRAISRQAYVPDEPLRLLARMIANDILIGSQVPNTTPGGLRPSSQQEDRADEKKNE